MLTSWKFRIENPDSKGSTYQLPMLALWERKADGFTRLVMKSRLYGWRGFLIRDEGRVLKVTSNHLTFGHAIRAIDQIEP